MRKTVWYLVHDLTDMTQVRFRSQKRLIKHLRMLGCCFDNNALPQITKQVMSTDDIDDESVGELYLETDHEHGWHDICVEEMA